MTFLDCKDKKIKSKKQILRFKIWQDELKALPLHSFFHSIRFKVNNYGTQRSPFLMPFYDTT